MQVDLGQRIDGPVKRDWKWWAIWYKAATYQFMLGFSTSAMGAAMLGDQRPGWIPFEWHEMVFWAFVASFAWYLWVTFPTIPGQLDPSRSGMSSGAKILLVLALLSTLLLRWQWNEAWAVVCLGPCAAIILWFQARAQNSRSYFAVAIWMVSGAAALALPWPNPQRFLAALIVGGLATCLNGAFAFVDFHSRLRKKLAQAY
jgi:hypothetical protein